MLGIQGGTPPMGLSATGSQNLSDTERRKPSDLLANDDIEDLSDEQAKEKVDGIKELIVTPGRGLSDVLGSLGLNTREQAQQAGTETRQDLGGQGNVLGGKGPDSAAVQTLQSVVERLLQTSSISEEGSDFSARLSAELQAAGIDTSSPVLDYKA